MGLETLGQEDFSGKALAEIVRPSKAQEREIVATSMASPTSGDPRLTAYAQRAWEGEVARLHAMREAAVPEEQEYRGEPWDATTFEVACNLLELANAAWSPYAAGDACAALMEHTPRDPGFTDAEIAKKIRSAIDTIGSKPRPVPAERLDVSDWDIPSAPVGALATSEPRDDADQPSWAPLDLSAVLDGTEVRPDPVLMPRTDGACLLYAGKTHSFHGESESGKSWVLLVETARCLLARERVLMVDFESDAATVVERLRRLGVDDEAMRTRFVYLRPELDFRKSTAERAAWQALLAQRFALVGIDGVTEALTIFGVASKDNDEVTGWLRQVARALAERTGAAVVLVDHVTKDADTRGRFAIGAQAKTSALTGASYVVEVVEPLGVGMVGRLALRVGKDRPGRVRPESGTWRKSDRTQEAAVVVIDSREPGRTVATVEPPRTTTALDAKPEASPFRPTALMERVSRTLEVASEPLSRTRLEQAVSGKALYVRQAVELLLLDGFLAADGPRVNGGHPTLRSVRPYREADDVPSAGTGSTAPDTQTPTPSPSRSSTGDGGTGSVGPSDPVPGRGGTGSGRGFCESCSEPLGERYGITFCATCGEVPW